MSTDEEVDLYATLGVPRDASDAALRAAYKKQALRYHPDKCGDEDAEAKFKAIGRAWSILSDPAQRTAYDHGELYMREEPHPEPADSYCAPQSNACIPSQLTFLCS